MGIFLQIQYYQHQNLHKFTLTSILGSSSCVIMGKLFVFMNGMLNTDKLFLINFIYSLGQALAQTTFPLLLQLLRKYICHNCALMILGALMFHTIPITMMIFETKISIRLKTRKETSRVIVKEEVSKTEESRITEPFETVYEDDYDGSEFCLDIKYPSDAFDMESNWKNPNSYEENNYKIDNFLEDLESHRIINAEGVEILQTILEDDEDVENRRSHSSRNKKKAVKVDIKDEIIETIYEQIQHDNVSQKNSENHFRIVYSTLVSKFKNFSNKCRHEIYRPLKRSMKICKFYPSVMLKACDIFSYLLFITLILPNLALKQFNFEDEGNVVYLIILMGFSWASYAFLVLVYHNLLKRNFMHYFHIIGLLGKFFGYLCK